MAQLNGTWQPGFGEVQRAFEANFVDYGEVGASVCVTVNGETVVDLWGGSVAGDSEEAAPWQADTLVTVFSCTKGATAICAHALADEGKLDLDAAVGDYWPEFATNGKERATVRMMLDHSVGVPAWREKLPSGSAYDWEYMVGRLEAEEPFWEPGTRHGYHMLSFGWTVGELVRRTSGRSLGANLAAICARVGNAGGPPSAKATPADFFIGLPEHEEHRVSKVIPYAADPANPSFMTQAVRADRKSITALGLLNQGGMNPNSRACHGAEIGGGGGLASARGLAGLYRPLALNDGGLVSQDHLPKMSEVAVATESDATLLIGTRFSLGFMKSMDNRRRPFGDHDSALLGASAFGHVGAGGSIGFADPACKLSVGYAMNRMGPGVLLNERGQGLVDAVYRCLGYRSNASGVWMA